MASDQPSSALRGRGLAGAHPAGKIRGAGEMANLIRAHDWANTPLGALEAWPEDLFSCLNTILASRFPMAIAWGPEMIQFYNDAYRPLFAEKHPGALGKSAAKTWKEAWHVVGPELEAALMRGEAIYRENVSIPMRRGGHLQDVYWTYSNSPIYTSTGEIAGVLSISHDVTGEVLTRQERDAFSARLSQVLDATTDAVVCVDRDWRISYMNPRAKEIAAPKGDVLGSNIWETLPQANRPGSLLREYLARAMQERIAGDFEGYYPEPLNIWADVHVRPTSDGVVAFIRDMTAQKRTEEALRDAVARRDAIYNTSLEYIGLLSIDGKMLDCNQASLEFAGNTREELLDRYFWECPWFAYTPGMPEKVRGDIELAAAGEHVRGDLSLTRPSGEVLTFDFSLTPVRDEEGNVLFLVPEGRDITSMKLTEAALKESEKLAAVGRLAASIAHEVNNPLEAVTNLLYLAKEAKDPGLVQRYLRDAERELHRVSLISNQTLLFYRQSTNPRLVRSEELIENAIATHQGRILNADIHVTPRLRARTPLNCFDGEIRQVLNNLIGNAIDAMRGGGGGRLLVRSREGTQWLSGRKGLVLTIADTGHGIDRENLKKVFEPFFSTKKIGGTGLGLWVSEEIVKRHLGSLRVRSSKKKGCNGTVFILFLPFDGVTREDAV